MNQFHCVRLANEKRKNRKIFFLLLSTIFLSLINKVIKLAQNLIELMFLPFDRNFTFTTFYPHIYCNRSTSIRKFYDKSNFNWISFPLRHFHHHSNHISNWNLFYCYICIWTIFHFSIFTDEGEYVICCYAYKDNISNFSILV